MAMDYAILTSGGKLCGFRVNRVDGNKLYPQEMPRVKPKTRLYRNFDQEFERVMQKKSAERKIAVTLRLEEIISDLPVGC